MSANRVILLGRLGRDADTRFTPSGDAVTSFSLATDERWTDKKTGEKKHQTEWHNVAIWRREGLAQYLTKGKEIYVEGKLKTRKYEKDGQTHYATEIIASEISFVGGGGGGSHQPEAAAAPASSAITDDDVPF